MERFNALGRGMQLMLVGSVLLLIDTFFHWQEVSIEFLGTKASSGVSAWHGFWGVVMGLLVIVLLAWLVARLAAVDIPVPVSLTGATLAFLIFAFALIKNLTDDYSTFWSYLGVGLAALIAAGGWLQVQEAGGVENLKSEASSVTGAVGGAAGGAAATGGAAAADTEPAPQQEASAEAMPATPQAAAEAPSAPAEATAAGQDAAAEAPSAPAEAPSTAQEAPADLPSAAAEAAGDAGEAEPDLPDDAPSPA